MKKSINIFIIFASVLIISACTHKKVDVSQMGDADKTCAQLASDIEALSVLESDIDSKTGFSGRNVGMALLFWPGIVINEVNGNDARDRASDRKEKLFALRSQKGCS